MGKIKKWIKKKRFTDKINTCFKHSDLYQTYTNSGGKVTYIYPKIHAITEEEDKEITEIVFTLQNGMNPKNITKYEYVFKQYFGRHIEFEGDVKKFVLRIFHNPLEETYAYRFEQFLPLMKKCKLPIIAGKDKLGNLHVFDMVANPMLLIAGETGGGKSSSIRGILTALIQFREYMENGLELHLVDFKRSEFHLFRHIQETYVMNQKKDLRRCLTYILEEIEVRGDILDTFELTHIDDYNKMKSIEKKPYMILCIDEVHMLEGEEDIFSAIHTISAMGRALGIFLIMATQRPDKDVIDGKIKSNLTMRYAFAHADKINSDITLGRGVKADASKITKEGQFIYRQKKANKTFEILQSPYLPPEDEKRIKGAKTLLEPFRIKIREENKDDNIIDSDDTVRKDVTPYTQELSPIFGMVEDDDHEE
ncbi:FtsK/SpoIIIE domain-containing protein [Sutcliffiella cohnii]|uniref:FtsK/SpoIIIE domain-containing protein n=1 Tax=Sutcliffiella cohnii TaxID=33932 RepID=UPI002E1ABE72|nr:FtsK/SpoIIIE domain-containing protein [Sutcliffiella cohnii]MED4017016.1 FtsK/SpoIIIE domain-containing protein [Sutcliffiella cohnii]